MSITNKHNPLVKAIRTALLASVAASMVVAPNVYAAEDEEDEEENVVTVTGSRIKRTDIEGALPVTVIDRDMIEMSGESNAADFLRNLTFNSGGSFRPQSGSSAQGVASINLRGIGSTRTLILLDGRRLPKSPATGSNQDLNSIPMGAIERIEILSDGASAVYGSDALGGVVNVITRQDFQGAEISLGSASISFPADGGDRENGSIMFGAASDTSNLMGGVSWNKRDIIFARDMPFAQGGFSSFGNNWSVGTNPYFVGLQPIPDGQGGLACDFPGSSFFFASGRCRFDFESVSADEASTGNKSLWLKAQHEFSEDWTIWANANVNKTDSFGRYAPVPDSSFFSGITISENSINNPTNPSGQVWDGVTTVPVPINYYHRFDAVGPRDSYVDNELVEVMTGMTGTVGDVELDFGIRKTENTYTDIGYNYLLRSAAIAAIEDGSYSMLDPYSTPDNVLNSIAVTISRIGRYDQDEVWFSASMDAFEMQNGFAQLVVGAEYREEDYYDQYDSLSEAGQVGGSAGNSAGGVRDVTSLYFEMLMPVLDNLEVTVAGRHEDYSDYGNDFAPKVSARWVLDDNMTVRASWGQGFRAPSLDILTQKDSFSADSVRDEANCLAQGAPANCSAQINGLVRANPALGSEKSDQYSFGFAHEINEVFNYTIDYYSIEINDRIASFTAQTLVSREVAGQPLPPGLSVTRDAGTGAITQVIRGSANEGKIDQSGIDVNLVASYEALSGRFNHNFQLGYVLESTVDDGNDTTGQAGSPDYRIGLQNTYELDNYSVGWNINVIGDQCGEFFTDGQCEEGDGKVNTYVTHDLQFNYFAPWEGRFSFGVRNAGEKTPQIGIGDVGSRDYDFELYDAYGRITYFNYSQSF